MFLPISYNNLRGPFLHRLYGGIRGLVPYGKISEAVKNS